jgi:hypothetical protein
MPMNRHMITAGLVSAVAILGTALMIVRGEPADRQREGFLGDVKGGVKPQQIGDLAQVLHIVQLEGQIQLNAGFRNMTLVFAAYKDGKKVEQPASEHAGLGQHKKPGALTYAVQIVDLDFLPLGNGKKGHCRVRVSFRLPDESTVSVEKDIPKGVIDLSQSSKGTFTKLASTGKEVPLLWLMEGGVVRPHPKTREEVLEGSKKGGLLFLTLRFDDPEGRKEKE